MRGGNAYSDSRRSQGQLHKTCKGASYKHGAAMTCSLKENYINANITRRKALSRVAMPKDDGKKHWSVEESLKRGGRIEGRGSEKV